MLSIFGTVEIRRQYSRSDTRRCVRRPAWRRRRCSSGEDTPEMILRAMSTRLARPIPARRSSRVVNIGHDRLHILETLNIVPLVGWANHLDRGFTFRKRQPIRSPTSDRVQDSRSVRLSARLSAVAVMRQVIRHWRTGRVKIFVGILRDEFAARRIALSFEARQLICPPVPIAPYVRQVVILRRSIGFSRLPRLSRTDHISTAGVDSLDRRRRQLLCQSDAGISRRRFDDRLPFGQTAFALGGFII